MTEETKKASEKRRREDPDLLIHLVEGDSESISQRLHREELAAMLMIVKDMTKDEALSAIEQAYSGIER